MKTLRMIVAMTAMVFFGALHPSAAEPGMTTAVQFMRVPAALIEPASMRPSVETRRQFDTVCLALALYHEARGEPEPGQLAVARVILNRMRSKVYPDTVCGVTLQGREKPFRCQFSFACDDLADLPRNAAAFMRLLSLSQTILEEGMPGRMLPGDPREYREADFHEITHYHADYVSPAWRRKIERAGQIGRHVFYRSERVARTL